MGNELCFPELRSYLCSIENMEKNIAIKNDKEQLHQKKWYLTKTVDPNNTSTTDLNLNKYMQNYLEQM